MPTITYQGDYGSSVTLGNPRTATVTADALPSGDVTVMSAYCRFYLSTTSKPLTFNLTASINDGAYTGTLDYKFSANDTPVYVNIPLNVTAGDANFPIKTITSVTISEGSSRTSIRVRGTVRVYVEYEYVGSPTAPSNVKVNGATNTSVQAGTTATLTWNRGYPGSNDTFSSYQIYRYNPSDGTYTSVGATSSLSYTVTAPYVDGGTYYYYVDIYCAYKHARSSPASIYTFIPLTAPAFLNGGSRPLYNPRPMLLVTLGNGYQGAQVSLVANGWTASKDALPGSKVYLRKNTRYGTDTEETVAVTQTDGIARTLTANIRIDYMTLDLTDSVIEAGTTLIKAAHITELQNAFDSVRHSYGMALYQWTACIAGVTPTSLWPTHIAELQACAREIAAFINAWDTESTTFHVVLPTMLTSYAPTAAVLTQLRTILTML